MHWGMRPAMGPTLKMLSKWDAPAAPPTTRPHLESLCVCYDS